MFQSTKIAPDTPGFLAYSMPQRLERRGRQPAETLLGMDAAEVWEFANRVADQIKKSVKTVQKFDAPEVREVGFRAIKRHEADGQWLRIRQDVLTLLGLLDGVDENWTLAKELRQVVRFVLRVLKDIDEPCYRHLKNDIKSLSIFLAQFSNRVAQVHCPEAVRKPRRPRLRKRFEPTPKPVEAPLEPVDMSRGAVNTRRALELVQTAAPMLDSTADLTRDKAPHYLVQNLVQLHDLCLFEEVDRSQVAAAFVELPIHAVPEIEFLLKAVEGLLNGAPSPLVKQRSRAMQGGGTAAEPVQSLIDGLERRAGRARKKNSRTKGKIRAKARAALYREADPLSALGMAKALVEEKSGYGGSWEAEVLEALEPLVPDELEAVVDRLCKEYGEIEPVQLLLTQIYVQQFSYEPIKNMLYSFFELQHSRKKLTPRTINALQQAGKDLTGAVVFRFLHR